MAREWWQDAVFYQIYPRSFADANGDGIGDLNGITAHLDYLNDGLTDGLTDGSGASLGIDAIWLSPINPSPLSDWGYDVSDYCDVHPDLGTLASFDRLVAEAHRRGIRIVLDLVPNHTSDQHAWFRESRSSRTNPKRDWYLWRRGRDGAAPNNWSSTFGGSAWEFDAASGEWYLHSFLREQPDLNFRNPEVVEAMHAVIRFWLDRGVDGFRVDVIAQMIKDAQFRDNPEVPKDRNLTQLERLAYEQRYSSDQPEVHDVIRGFRRVLDGYPARMMVGEVWPRDPRSLADYLRADELQQAFNFRFLFSPWQASAFRSRIEEVESLLGPDAWPTYTLSNHDFPRHITRYGASNAEARARMAAVLLLTMRGTPFIYYGEEIGMPNVGIPADRKRDPMGRDGCRTPMQWTAKRNGGFTTASEAWLPLGDCNAINVEKQLGDASSMLALYRRMIHLRKHSRALSEGTYRTEAHAPDDCLIFHREAPTQRVMVALNFSDAPRRIEVPRASILLSTDRIRRDDMLGGVSELSANEALILKIS
jgi:alpha-glucosidase